MEVLCATAVLLTVPLLLATLGEIVAERAGILNVGIEGVMLGGAFAAAGAIQLGLGRSLAVLGAVVVGAALGGLLAVVLVHRQVNQVVGGVLFNLLALGLTTVLFTTWFDNGVASDVYSAAAVPGLSELPFVGPVLFDQPVFVYACVVVVALVHHLLTGTWFGLHVRAAGERPHALDVAGVSVTGIRTAALALGCALAALGGAALVVLQSGAFAPNMTEGRGFIALGIALLARWRPWWALPAVGVFGLAEGVQYQADNLGLASVPPELLGTLPYLVAIVVVAVGTAARYPAAVGVPYARE